MKKDSNTESHEERLKRLQREYDEFKETKEGKATLAQIQATFSRFTGRLNASFLTAESRLKAFCEKKGLPLPKHNDFYDWLVHEDSLRFSLIADLPEFSDEQFIKYCKWKSDRLEQLLINKTDGTKEKFIELFNEIYNRSEPKISQPKAYQEAEDRFRKCYGFNQVFFSNFRSFNVAFHNKTKRERESKRKKNS